MQWHIITGSKGGVGKTLLTLMLLEHHLERKPEEGVLVLDLNSINTDTSTMLLYNKEVGKPITYSLGVNINDRKLMFRKTYSFDEYNKSCYFGVGWPENPFALYEYSFFAVLLCRIRDRAEDIARQLDIQPVQSVIIDTNYHFCNLFSEKDDGYYEKYIKEGLTNDTMTIWFLWVYRQLFKLIREGRREDEIITATAGTIERLFEKRGIGPIVHAYTPMGLLSVQSDMGNWWRRMSDEQPKVAKRRDRDHTIAKLAELEKLPVGKKTVGFQEWTKTLRESYTFVRSRGKHENEDPHLLFVNVLDNAVRRIAKNGEEPFLPLNIFPLSVYQSALEYYTDKDREDVVAALRNLTIYKNFSRLLDRKYESFLL